MNQERTLFTSDDTGKQKNTTGSKPQASIKTYMDKVYVF